MNAPVAGASDDDARTPAILTLRTHYRLADRPQSTLEALRVFFPGDATRILGQLQQHPVTVRRGDYRVLHALAVSLRAQGFECDVRLETEPGAPPVR